MGAQGLLQVVAGAPLKAADSSCSPLTNHDTFSTVEVLIGTPPQKFDLVADTGSNDVIVQSCICQENGYCSKRFGKCFRGTNRSSSFVMHHRKNSSDPQSLLLSFGSGQIMAVAATDNVQVGGTQAQMGDSLLLMVKHALNLQGPFEGILGLGRPTSAGQNQLGDVPGFLQQAKVDRFSMCFKYKGDGVLGLNTPQQKEAMGSVGALHWGLDFQGISVGEASNKVLFCSPELKKPGQQSACGFIPDSGTTLMMGPEKQILSLYADLCQRWERCKKTHLGIVKELEALKQQNGPLEQGLNLLQNNQNPFGAHGWADIIKNLKNILGHGGMPPSNASSSQDYGDDSSGSATSMISPAETFQLLLEDCEQWIGNDTALKDEMPSLFFHAAGANGNKTKVLQMHPEAYVIQSTQEVAHREIKKLMGIFPVNILEKKNKTVCMPAFGKMDYPTKLNGDVWILGTPLFYQFNVHYDRAASPPSMTLVEEDCGHCQAGKLVGSGSASLLDRSATEVRGMDALRRLNSSPVVSHFDQSLPL